MPSHPSYNFEKVIHPAIAPCSHRIDIGDQSPVDHRDFSGLQLDTRAREISEKHLDASKPQGFLDDDFDEGGNYLNEKQSHTHLGVSEWGPASPASTIGSSLGPVPSPISPTPLVPPKSIDEALGAPPPIPPERTILGLRRKPFWVLFATILILVIAVAVIGGVVGGLQARNGKSGSLSASSASPASNATNGNVVPLNSSDVMVGSPLSVVTYDEGPGESYKARQAFRVVYQSAIGDIKEAVSYHEEPWLVAVPIFSNAVNHTGLASATYLNATSQQGSVFYVGTTGLLQENRKIYNNSDPWIPGTLNHLNLAVAGNFSAVPEEAPQNGWDGYRMAAVYSPNFQDGPGIRLFYHAEAQNGTSFVQELIWNLKNDAWSKGATFSKPYAYSHLAVVVDESQKILRLLFSSGGKTLSEEWLDISNIQAGYSAGLDFAGLLYNDAADIAAVSLFGTTYVYHYSAASQKAKAGIHELTITGVPSSVNSKETYNLSSPLVAAPLLNTSNGDVSLYQPLAASYTAVPGLTQQLFVIWADKPSGDPKASVSGFSDLQEISRSMANPSWDSSTQMSLPLGSLNLGPPDPGSPGTSMVT